MQIFHYFWFFIFLTFYISISYARPWIQYLSQDLIPNPKIPDFITQKLPSGIDVYYMPDVSSHKIRCVLTLKIDDLLRVQEHAGITDLWASTVEVFGTKEYPREKFARYLETHATNFSISSDLKYIQISITAFSHFFWDDLKLILDAVQNPNWEDSVFKLYQEKETQELKRKLENPAYLSKYLSTKNIYKNNIRSNLLVSPYSFQNITFKDLKNWHRKIWSMVKIRVHASGNFQPDQFSEKLASLFDIYKMDPTSDFIEQPSILLNPFESGFPSQTVFYYVKEIPQTVILLVAKAPRNTETDVFSVKVFNFLLGGDSFNSELVQKIRVEHGWAYTVYSQYITDQYSGLNYIFVQSQNENIQNIVKKLYSILSEAPSIVSINDLKRAQLSITNKYVFLYETFHELLERRVYLLRNGLPQNYYTKYLSNIRNISVNDLTKVSKNYYNPNKYTWVVVGPENVFSQLKEVLPSSFRFTMLPESLK